MKKEDLLLLSDKLVFLDVQLLNFRVQGRSGNSKFGCRTSWASDFPLAFRQCGFNNFFFLLLESVRQRTRQFLPGRIRAGQPRLFDPKSVAAAMAAVKSRLVAAMTRTSVGIVRLPPTRSNCHNRLSTRIRFNNGACHGCAHSRLMSNLGF